MTAVLQFEIDKKRLGNFMRFTDPQYKEALTPFQYVYQLASAALLDTFDNGGTFVMVSGKEKITIVQRAEAEEFDSASSPRTTP